MGRRRIGWAICFAMLLVAAGAGWVAYSTREPSYGGKSLTEWLSLHSQQKVAHWEQTGKFHVLGEKPDEAEIAIRKIGTNALPQLVRMVGAKDSPLKLKIWSWLRSHPAIRVPFRMAIEDRVLATWGFDALGAEAKPAVPALIRLMDDKDEMVRRMAMKCLEDIGPAANDAVPALSRALDDPGLKMRSTALFALLAVHVPGDDVVPRLIKKLETVRKGGSGDYLDIIAMLGDLGPEARAAVPTLVSIAHEEIGTRRMVATNALMRIEPDMVKFVREEEISPWIKRDWEDGK
jgi:HEAT repeats